VGTEAKKPKLKLVGTGRVLPIHTHYFTHAGGRAVRINRAGSALRAVPLCVEHMQLNHYEATVAEVFDTRGGVLHAVIRRTVEGNIRIVFKREVKEGQ
jgi:hypothetical protein